MQGRCEMHRYGMNVYGLVDFYVSDKVQREDVIVSYYNGTIGRFVDVLSCCVIVCFLWMTLGNVMPLSCVIMRLEFIA